MAEQPSDDDLKGHWDKIVLSTASFPDRYWDKFVKKKVGSVIKIGLSKLSLRELEFQNIERNKIVV